MRALIDTNVLLRLYDREDPRRAECTKAISQLRQSRECLHVCAQVLIEFWVAATRPIGVNGFGLDTADADNEIADFIAVFDCLPEPPDMAEQWRVLARKYSVRGKQAHDARIAALMLAHNVSHILTLNPSDFARYDGITAVTPQDILQQAS